MIRREPAAKHTLRCIHNSLKLPQAIDPGVELVVIIRLTEETAARPLDSVGVVRTQGESLLETY